MKKTTLSLLIPFLAGIFTTLGYLPTYIPKKYQDVIIPFSLSFSAGIMLIISSFSLIPEAFHYLSNQLTFPVIFILLIMINLGFILSLSIDTKLEEKINQNKLYKLGILSIITLIIHNIPEGMIAYLTIANNLKLGVTLSLAIALHNIPEGIAIAIPIYYSTANRKRAFIYTIISGFSEFLGAILIHLFFHNTINLFIMSSILSVTAGIMIHLALFDLLPNSIVYNNRKTTIIGFILGIVIMLICIFSFQI